MKNLSVIAGSISFRDWSGPEWLFLKKSYHLDEVSRFFGYFAHFQWTMLRCCLAVQAAKREVIAPLLRNYYYSLPNMLLLALYKTEVVNTNASSADKEFCQQCSVCLLASTDDDSLQDARLGTEATHWLTPVLVGVACYKYIYLLT